ncbi:MAG TPA: hypothetical protein PLJ29_09100 [Leptospiraceae bacterium]|nr:hypothetical protein [Leptospiraceae bacterium]HNF28162.1 hypothetical protein [Leptospiraceae bacterium]HNI26500.1 hypothetical protein [Leptospiraceae bacterium]HNM02739.1 hypothetical protein [Leptospiraceae bacterium]HNN06571.1 hypothetical protein [Leptospiraceae bacterium]
MNQRTIIALFIAIVIFFLYSSRAIVGVKIQELRFYLAKEQLLNYELSSKVLREKIKQMMLSKDDYRKEIANSILESNIMNSEVANINPDVTVSDRVGLVLVNSVRVISLKTPLTLVEDQNSMLLVQYAFYMERTRKFATALKKYEELQKRFGRQETNENGFVMLHHGFCLAMTGEIEGAITKLQETESVFAGTHFADNARVLINALLEGQKKTLEIQNNSLTSQEKAALLYESGNYRKTLEELEKVQNRDDSQNFMRARSLEELGQSSSAISEYIELAKQRRNEDVAKKANRRLVLIGNIYEKNETISQFSKENAKELGDNEIVKEAEQGASLVASSVVIKKLTSTEAVSSSEGDKKPEIDPKELEALKKELEKVVIEEKKERSEKVDKILPPAESEKKKEETALLLVRLHDGRDLKGKILTVKDDMYSLSHGLYSVDIPESIISEIIFDSTPLKPETRIYIQYGAEKYYKTKAVKRDGDFFVFKLDNGKEEKISVEDVKKIFLK